MSASVHLDGSLLKFARRSSQSITNSIATSAPPVPPRVVSRDYVVRFQNRMFQVMRSHPPTVVRPGTRVEVHTWLDGSLHVVTTAGKRLRVEQIKHEQRTSKENALSA